MRAATTRLGKPIVLFEGDSVGKRRSLLSSSSSSSRSQYPGSLEKKTNYRTKLSSSTSTSTSPAPPPATPTSPLAATVAASTPATPQQHRQVISATTRPNSNFFATKEASSTLINMMRTRADAVHVHAAFDVCTSSTDLTMLEWYHFSTFVNSCTTLRTLDVATVEKIFYAACSQERTNLGKEAVGRETFFWAVVRLAAARYPFNSATSALRRLVQEDLSVPGKQIFSVSNHTSSSVQAPHRQPPVRPTSRFPSPNTSNSTNTSNITPPPLNWSEMYGVVPLIQTSLQKEDSHQSTEMDSNSDAMVQDQKQQKQQQQKQQQQKQQKEELKELEEKLRTEQEQTKRFTQYTHSSQKFAARIIGNIARRWLVMRQAVLWERWKNMCLLSRVQSKLLENVTKYTKKRLLLTCLRRVHRGRITITFSKWCRITTTMKAIDDGAEEQHRLETLHSIVRLIREHGRDMLRRAMQCLKDNVEAQRSSDSSLMYGRMMENLQVQMGATEKISAERATLVEKEQKKLEYWSQRDAKMKEQRVHQLTARVLHRLGKESLRAVLVLWKSFKEHRCWLRRFIMHKISETARCWKLTAFAHWTKITSELNSQMSMIGRRWRRLSCSIFFQIWKKKVEIQKHETTKLHQCLRKLSHGQLSRGFHSWHSAARQATQNRVAVTRALKRWQQRHVVICFVTWVKYVDQQREMQKLASCIFRSVVRVQKRQVATTFRLWIQLNYQKQRVESLRRRTLLNLSVSALPRTFFPWKSKTLRAKRHRQLSNKILRRLKYRKSHRSFRSWSFAAKALKRRRNLVQRIICRLQRKILNSGLRTWVMSTVRTKEDELYTALERSDLNVAKTQIYRIYSRLIRSSLVTAWNTWAVQFIHSERRLDHLKARVLKTWLQQTIRAAFTAWQHRLSDIKRLRRLGKSVGLQWQHRQLSHVFRAWLLFVERRVFVRRMFTHRAAKIKRHKQSTAFRSLEKATQERRMLVHTSNIAHRGYRKAALAVFHRLDRVASTRCRTALEAFSRNTKEKQRIACLLKRHRQAWSRRLEYKAIRIWHERVMQSVYEKQVIRRALGALRHKKLNRYWRIMYVKVQQRSLVRHLLRTAVYRYAHALLTAGFHAIKSRASIVLAQSIETKRTARLAAYKASTMKRLYRRIQFKFEKIAFAKMYAHSQELQRAKKRAARCLNRWKLKKMHRAYTSWTHNVGEIKRIKQLYQRVVLRLTKRRACSTLMAWMDFVVRRARARELVYIISSGTRYRNMTFGFDRWRLTTTIAAGVARTNTSDKLRYLQTHAAGARLLFSALKIHASLILVRAMATWSTKTKRAAGVEHRCRAFVRRYKMLHLSAAFQGLKFQVFEQKRLQAYTNNIIARMQLSLETKAFRQWQSALNIAHHQRLQTKRALRSWKKMLQHRSLQSWKYFVGQRLLNQQGATAVQRVLHRLEKNQIHKCLRTWKHMVEHVQQQERTMNIIHRRWHRRTTYSAFATWHTSTANLIHLRSVILRATRRMQHRSLCYVWNTWCTFQQRRRRLRAILSRNTMKQQRNNLRMALLGKLLPFAQASVYKNHEHLFKLKQQQNATRMIIQHVRRYYRRVISTHFERWCVQIQTLLRLEKLAKKARARFGLRSQCLAFDRWAYQAERQIRYRQLMIQCTLKIIHRLLSATFRSWTHAVHKIIRDRAQMSMSVGHVRDGRVGELMTRLHTMAVTRMVHMILHHHSRRTFTHWQKVISEGKYYSTLVVMSQRHAAKHIQRVHFGTWCNSVRFLQKLSTMVQRMRSLTTGRAFTAWQRSTRIATKRASLLKVLIFAKCKRSLRYGMRRWTDTIAWLKHEEATRYIAIKFWQHRHLSMCTRAWHINVCELIASRHALRQALLRMQKIKASRCFHGWKDKLMLRKLARSDVRRLVTSMLKQTKRIYLAHWYMTMKEEKRALECSHRALSFWRHQHLAHALHRWVDNISESLRLSTLQRKVGARIFRLKLNHAFQGWQAAIVTLNLQKDQLHRVLTHYVHKQQACALQSWRAGVKLINDIEVKRHRAILRWRHRQLHCLFERWVILSEQARHERHLLVKSVCTIRAGMLGRVYRSWHVLAVLRVRRLHQLSRVCETVGQKYRSQTFKAFLRWRTQTSRSNYQVHMDAQAMQLEEAAAQTILLDRQSELWQLNFFHRMQSRRIYFDTFLCWKRFAKTSKRTTRTLEVATRRLRVLRLARCFEKWSIVAVESAETHEIFFVAAKRLGVLIVRLRKSYLRRVWGRLRGAGGPIPTALGAPLEVIQQIEWTFARNLDRSIVAKEHVQDVSISMLRRQYNRVLVARMFSRWAGTTCSTTRHYSTSSLSNQEEFTTTISSPSMLLTSGEPKKEREEEKEMEEMHDSKEQ